MEFDEILWNSMEFQVSHQTGISIPPFEIRRNLVGHNFHGFQGVCTFGSWVGPPPNAGNAMGKPDSGNPDRHYSGGIINGFGAFPRPVDARRNF